MAGTPIRRGDKKVLTDDEVGTIVFNETGSFYGPGIDAARVAPAHAIVNGDERLGTKRPGTAGKAIERRLGMTPRARSVSSTSLPMRRP